MKKLWKRVVTVLTTAMLCFPGAALAAPGTSEETPSTNKYNVVFVIDESGSMLDTDANQLRYEATDLFLGLMSQEGNYVGTVSFDDTIIYSQDMMPVDAPEDKDVISGAIKEHSATNGDTDIGAAMEQAVNMLKSDGNPDLPSTIILLTDGNTDLDNDPGAVSEEEEASVEKKSAAIASAREAGIPVYSVCLNENGEADFSETKQISDATGGQAQEVTDAADLTNVYEMFYRLIYGTGTTCILDGIVPVDATYTVPDIGVEEANVMIEGHVTDIQFTDPSGNPYTDIQTTQAGNITLEKIVDPAAGEWTVSVDGDPGAKVKINLLYNYNFLIRDNTQLSEESYNQGDTVQFSAQLTDMTANPLALTPESGYAAEVRFVDENDQDLEALPMSVADGSFVLDYEIPEMDRAYRYYIAVLLESNEDSSVYKRTATRQFVSGSNTAPVSNGDVEETVKLWPFKDNTYTLDLTTLATDAEDSQLQYSVVSTSFINKADDPEGDYTIEGNTLTQDNYSLRKGDYVIRCVDSGGLYCDVNVTVTSIPIGMMAVIGLIILIAVIAAVVLFGIYRAMKTPFWGDIYVKPSYDGEEVKRTKNRGRIKLNVFNIPIPGIDVSKSYFQANRGESVILVTDKEVTVGGRSGREHEIRAGGTGTEVRLGDADDSVIYVRFASRLSGGVRRGGARKNTSGSRGTGRRGTPSGGGTAGRGTASGRGSAERRTSSGGRTATRQAPRRGSSSGRSTRGRSTRG